MQELYNYSLLITRETYIPPPLTSSLQYYPNPFITIQQQKQQPQQQQLNLENDQDDNSNNNDVVLWWTNENERQQLFHPVIKLPKNKNHYILSDYSSNNKRSTKNNNDNTQNLANDIERTSIRTMNIVQKFIRHVQLGTIPTIYYWLSIIQNKFTVISLFFRKNNTHQKLFNKVHYLKQNQIQEKNDYDDDENNNDNANDALDEQQSLLVAEGTSTDTITKAVTTGSTRKTDKLKTKTILCYYGIGKYDENRVSLYKSELFDNVTNSINGYSGQRTVHVGIDLNGPLGTVVYSVADGILYAAGYNPALGDYGYVIVVHHTIQLTSKKLSSSSNKESNTTFTTKDSTYSCSSNDGTTSATKAQTKSISFYALYGHLDEYTTRSIRNQYKKQQQQEQNLTSENKTTPIIKIKKGQILGRLGDIDENGGWKIPHVHFQLSINEPLSEPKHDLPGAVTYNDRSTAHWDYPDPRHILGELY